MAKQRVEAHEGEYGFDFKFYLKDANGAAYTTLAGTETPTLWLKEPGEDAFSIGTGSVNDTATGEIYVAIDSSDASDLEEGVYSGQLEIAGAAILLITMEVEVRIKRRIGS